MNARVGFVVAVIAAIAGIAAANFIVPQEYYDRTSIANAVVKEFRMMFDSVFGPIADRPYRENVFVLLQSMDRFLSQSPDLVSMLDAREVDEVAYFVNFIRQKTEQGYKFFRNLKHLPAQEIERMYHRHVDWIKNGFTRLERNVGMYMTGVGRTALEQYLEPTLRDIGMPIRALGQVMTCVGATSPTSGHGYGSSPIKYGYSTTTPDTTCPACQIGSPPRYH